ncbi:MAG: hypothetical protein QXW98_04595 [Candidatus Caldarchaeum sp.]
MSEKRKKELLAAISDGLDVLLGLEKEEKKEVKEREKPADTFSGLLQSLIPLVILPSVMPLFQQAFGQTLRETTVNVKVESATSIIPIDITAQTAILAVDIRAQTVTLNIRIIESTTTINVAVQGDASIIISGQNVGVALTGTWQTFTGYNKVFWSEGHSPGIPRLDNKFSNTLIQYTPPADKELYIESISINMVSRICLSMGNVYGTGASYFLEGFGGAIIEVFIYIGNAVVAKLVLGSSNPSITYQPITPLKVNGGITFKIVILGNPYGVWCSVTVLGYEKTTT